MTTAHEAQVHLRRKYSEFEDEGKRRKEPSGSPCSTASPLFTRVSKRCGVASISPEGTQWTETPRPVRHDKGNRRSRRKKWHPTSIKEQNRGVQLEPAPQARGSGSRLRVRGAGVGSRGTRVRRRVPPLFRSEGKAWTLRPGQREQPRTPREVSSGAGSAARRGCPSLARELVGPCLSLRRLPPSPGPRARARLPRRGHPALQRLPRASALLPRVPAVRHGRRCSSPASCLSRLNPRAPAIFRTRKVLPPSRPNLVGPDINLGGTQRLNT